MVGFVPRGVDSGADSRVGCWLEREKWWKSSGIAGGRSRVENELLSRHGRMENESVRVVDSLRGCDEAEVGGEK